jgi:uncharacterized Zn ribbon protein
VSHQTVPCQRDGCSNEFTVDDGQESARCPSCGKEHAAPWDQYDAGGEASAATVATDGAGDVRVESDGVEVTITIDVRPAGGGA